jgi:hypothetical protein
MTKEQFKSHIFENKKYTPDIRLLKLRLVYLYQYEEYETMARIQKWIEELESKNNIYNNEKSL